jgi:arsenate reductase
MSLFVYGIPTCSTCTKAQKWLDAQSITYTWVNTRDSAPTSEQIAQWVEDIGSKAMKNTSGGSYRALGEEKNTWNDAQWVKAFAADPMLLKRPLFVHDGHAVCSGFRADAEEKITQISKK